MIGLCVFFDVALTAYLGFVGYVIRETNRDIRKVDAEIEAMHHSYLERKFHV